jgi:protein-S-isoprenylcysteine O-methyltransferase Ste14
MRFLGIVPKVAALSAPYAFLAPHLNKRFSADFFQFTEPGALLVAIGVALWLTCYLQVSKAYRRGELLTRGCYSKVRHPIYSIWGFLILPGFSLVIGGFMVFLPLVYWLSVVKFIGEEEGKLEEKFGEEWVKYRKKTPRFIPRV